MVVQDDLLKANGRIQASAPFATIIGPLLAALLLAATSLQAVLWCDALTFVVIVGRKLGLEGLSEHGSSFLLASIASGITKNASPLMATEAVYQASSWLISTLQ
jgi:hypothetical protein